MLGTVFRRRLVRGYVVGGENGGTVAEGGAPVGGKLGPGVQDWAVWSTKVEEKMKVKSTTSNLPWL